MPEATPAVDAEPTVPAVPPVPTRRERARQATLAEIRSTALDLMRDQGTTDVRFTDIARVMGLTAPALYRYYDDRDALLTDLITEGFDDLAQALQDAGDALPEDAGVGERMHAVAGAYRRWAVDEPQRFALIFGLPVPGYQAPEEGPTVEAAQRAMANLAAVVHLAAQAGRLGEPLQATVSAAVLASMAEQDATGKGEDQPPAVRQAMIHAWAALHGFVVLETYGHLDWFAEDAREDLFHGQVEVAALVLGMRLGPDAAAQPGGAKKAVGARG
jgi:AcrR family transcriptional regulator